MNPFNCNTCLAGYSLVNGACQPDITCNTFGNCLVCPIGYAMVSASNTTYINQTCLQCSTSNCARCDSTGQTCISCSTGYFLSEPTCTQCSQGCATCLGSNFCLSCATGFIPQ